jgi:hypothetical protein
LSSSLGHPTLLNLMEGQALLAGIHDYKPGGGWSQGGSRTTENGISPNQKTKKRKGRTPFHKELERTASDRIVEAGEIRKQRQGDKRKQFPSEKQNMNKRDHNEAAKPGEVGEPVHKKQKNTSLELGKSIESRIETKAEKRFRKNGRQPGDPKNQYREPQRRRNPLAPHQRADSREAPRAQRHLPDPRRAAPRVLSRRRRRALQSRAPWVL